MKTNDLVVALTTFNKYYNNSNGDHYSVGSNIFYVDPTDKEMTIEDIQLVKQLGFQQYIIDEREYNPNAYWLMPCSPIGRGV